MLIFVAIFVVICCGLVIILGISLSCKLESVGDDISRMKELVSKINTELPYNSWFMNSLRHLDEKLDDINDHLTTEIACLATNNNEDIKRSKEGFLVGDVIEYGGEETLVLDRQTATLNIGEELTDYIIWSVTQGIQHVSASHLEHNAKFLRRASLNE